MKKIYLLQFLFLVIVSCFLTLSSAVLQKNTNAYSLDVESLTFGDTGVRYVHCLKSDFTMLSMEEWTTKATATAKGITGSVAASTNNVSPSVYVFVYECVGSKKQHDVCNILQVGTWMVIGNSTTPIRLV